MRPLNFLLVICCIPCFMACESDDLEMQDAQEVNKTEKKSSNEFDYWYAAIEITDYFSSYYLPPILNYIRNDDLAAVGVYVTPDSEYGPPSYDDLEMYLKWDNGWSILLDQSGRDYMYLLYNRPIPISQKYVKVDVHFNYVPGSSDAYIIFNQDGTYDFSGFGGERKGIQVILGVDKTDTEYGFKDRYVSFGINEGYHAYCNIFTYDLSDNNYVYPKRY